MKIKQNHLQEITAAFLEVGKEKIKAHRLWLMSPENPRPARDLEKRLRWDVMNSALGSKWICDNLYPYLDDTHIDTAIKHVFTTVIA